MNKIQELLWHDYLRLLAFAQRMLDPEDFGYAVTAEVRDAAREAIGINKAESSDIAKT